MHNKIAEIVIVIQDECYDQYFPNGRWHPSVYFSNMTDLIPSSILLTSAVRQLCDDILSQ